MITSARLTLSSMRTMLETVRTILKAAMRNLHGEEHAFLPGETAGSSTKR